MDICNFMQVRQGFEIPISRYQRKWKFMAGKFKKVMKHCMDQNN